MRRPCLATASFLLAAAVPLCAVHAADPPPQLTLDDVQTIIAQAVSKAVKIDPNAMVAVVDREGFVLGVWDVAGRTTGKPNDPLVDLGTTPVGGAIREAGHGVLPEQRRQRVHHAHGAVHHPAELSARRAQHRQRPAGRRGIFQHAVHGREPLPAHRPRCRRRIAGRARLRVVRARFAGYGHPNTRLSGRSGSVPLYKNNILVGGIGVFGDTEDSLGIILAKELGNAVPAGNPDEVVALAGQIGYKPPASIRATNVTINVIGVPYVDAHVHRDHSVLPFASLPGKPVLGFSLHASPPPFPYPTIYLGGQQDEIRFKIINDPTPGTINGQPRLTAAEVTGIMDRASDRARTTRAGIRNPVGVPMEVWITVVGNPNANNTPAPILGIVRTPGATFFSYDVALQKARTALFFSSNAMALSSRTVGFLAQNFYPPGLEGRQPGPLGPEVPSALKTGLPDAKTVGNQVADSLNGLPNFLLPVAPPGVTVDGTRFAAGAPNPNLPNGITVFPGGFPLYRNGQLIGAVGISGDGVDQDDIVGASASARSSTRRGRFARTSLPTTARGCRTRSSRATRSGEGRARISLRL